MLQTNKILIIHNGKALPHVKEFYLRCSLDSLFPLVEVKDTEDLVRFFIPEKISSENGKTYFFVKEIADTLTTTTAENTTNVINLHK